MTGKLLIAGHKVLAYLLTGGWPKAYPLIPPVILYLQHNATITRPTTNTTRCPHQLQDMLEGCVDICAYT